MRMRMVGTNEKGAETSAPSSMRMRMVGTNEKGAETSAPSHSTPRRMRRSVAEAAVFQRGRDIDAHVVVDGALRGDLLQIEGLRHAVEIPGEFPPVRDELDDFTVVHVHPAGVRADDDGAFGVGGACGLAVAVGIGQGKGR